MTNGTERYQVVHHIVTELALGYDVMGLQVFHGTAFLAPPSIAFQDSISGDCVLL
jgi:hypothetical protein